MKITTDNTPQEKVTPLGIIPNEWKILPLQKVGKIYSGGTPDTKEPSYWNGDILWCTPSDITKLKTRFITNTNQKITQLGLKNSSATLLPPGCILVCTRATIGNAAITLKETSTNQGFKNIKPIKDINVDWLFYCIASNKHRLVQLGGGSTFLEISKKDFEKFKIAIPPLPEQQKIAEIISTWDKAIEKQSQLIEKLELRKKGLMQQLLTGKQRLPGFSDPWKVYKLGELFQERNEKNRTDLPLLSISGDHGVILQTESNKRDTSNEDKSKYKRINKGDIGYNTMRMWQGRSALSDLEGIVSPAYTIVTPNKGVDGYYMSNLFKQPRLMYDFWTHSQGLVEDTLNCKYRDFGKVRINCPSYIEQKAISKIITATDHEIELAKQKLELFRQQKHGLMQQLLTGKKRVKL